MAKTDRQKIGDWGEEIACRFLERKGYSIIDRNVREKWGEIDIICRKPNVYTEQGRSVLRRTFLGKILSFFSTKKRRNTQTFPQASETLVFVEVKTLQTTAFNPAESVTPAKQKRIIRSCQAYLKSERLPKDTDWQIDVISVILDRKNNQARVEHLEQAVYYWVL